MANKGLAECLQENFLSNWEFIGRFKKPLIAAVNGYAVPINR
jgi:enoyl-CoA hydratase/carnithine racemase